MSRRHRGDFICPYGMRDTMPAYPLGAKMSDEPGKITAKYYVDTIPPSARHIEHPFKIDMGYKLPMENVVIDNANAIADNATEVMNLSKGEQDANYDPFLVQPRDSKEENKQRLMQATWLRRSQNFSSAIFTPKKQKLAKVSQREQERATRDSQTDAYLERDHRVAFMEKMFDGSYHSEMTHPRTGKRVKRMYDVIQDDIVPDTTYTLCTFTDNPADRVRLNKRKHLGPELQGRQAATLDGTDRGILRPFSNPHDPNDSYLIWFLPNEQGTERLLQHKQDPTDNSIFDGTVDYYNVREFVYEDANTSRQKSALITMHGDKAYLKPIPSRMRCRQRRKASKARQFLENYEKPEVLEVQYTQ